MTKELNNQFQTIYDRFKSSSENISNNIKQIQSKKYPEKLKHNLKNKFKNRFKDTKVLENSLLTSIKEINKLLKILNDKTKQLSSKERVELITNGTIHLNNVLNKLIEQVFLILSQINEATKKFGPVTEIVTQGLSSSVIELMRSFKNNSVNNVENSKIRKFQMFQNPMVKDVLLGVFTPVWKKSIANTLEKVVVQIGAFLKSRDCELNQSNTLITLLNDTVSCFMILIASFTCVETILFKGTRVESNTDPRYFSKLSAVFKTFNMKLTFELVRKSMLCNITSLEYPLFVLTGKQFYESIKTSFIDALQLIIEKKHNPQLMKITELKIIQLSKDSLCYKEIDNKASEISNSMSGGRNKHKKSHKEYPKNIYKITSKRKLP